MTDRIRTADAPATETPVPARAHGIHHVTAISGEPRRVLDFYVRTLGMRLVKRTVNFDDPGTYHFYFGDETGTPGSLFTVFPWASGRKGRVGAGQVGETVFSIPAASLGWWLDRLAAHHVTHELPQRRFGADGETVVSFTDPDGMRLALAADPRAAAIPGWSAPGADAVPAEHAIRGVHGVTLWVDDPDGAAALLGGPMGMRRVAADGATVRFVADEAVLGRVVDVRDVRGFWEAADGVGSVHHVAFRVGDAAEELALRAAVEATGLRPTPVRDRHYFESVYFRAPGGVLFELATDGPGFLVDEPRESLGESLRLPPAFEPHRASIEAGLPDLTVQEVIA
jgi:glyoxalase family protein